MLLWGGEDELECDVSRDRMEEETSRAVNGFVLDAGRETETMIEGRVNGGYQLEPRVQVLA